MNAIFRGAGNAAIAMQSLWIANIPEHDPRSDPDFGWGPDTRYWGGGCRHCNQYRSRRWCALYRVYYLMGDRGIIKIHKENVRIDTDIIVRLLKVSAATLVSFLSLQPVGSFLPALWSTLEFICRISDSHPGNYLHHPAFMGYVSNAAKTLVGQTWAGHPSAPSNPWKADS